MVAEFVPWHRDKSVAGWWSARRIRSNHGGDRRHCGGWMHGGQSGWQLSEKICRMVRLALHLLLLLVVLIGELLKVFPAARRSCGRMWHGGHEALVHGSCSVGVRRCCWQAVTNATNIITLGLSSMRNFMNSSQFPSFHDLWRLLQSRSWSKNSIKFLQCETICWLFLLCMSTPKSLNFSLKIIHKIWGLYQLFPCQVSFSGFQNIRYSTFNSKWRIIEFNQK